MLFGQQHVDRYRETDGEEGHDWEGTQVAILTTTGRKSGEQRPTPLIYGEAGDDYMVVASDGGADSPPTWYLNLQANPEAELQVKGDRFKVRSRDATPEERPDLWKRMTSQWPAYDHYQTRTDRQIQLVVLERLAAL